MNNFQVLGKYLDQPILAAKFQKKVPVILGTSAVAFATHKTMQAKKGEKSNTAIKTGFTLGATVASALYAPKIASKFAKRELQPSLAEIKKQNTEYVENFLKSNNIDLKTKELLNKTKNDVLSLKEIKNLYENLSKNKKGKDILEKIVPPPETMSAKKIFSEIGYLSALGAVPVAGGIAGGITGDILTDKNNWKDRIPNKIKEGTYQYLANIFLCNVGAGGALWAMEKKGIKSRTKRALGMIAGIIVTGIIGGDRKSVV